MLPYLLVRGRQDGPLFRFRDGKPLTRQQFVSAVCGALVKAGIKAQLYAGHTFWIGSATTAGRRCDVNPVQLVSGVTPTM